MANDILHNLTTIRDGFGIIIAALLTGLCNIIGIQGPALEFLLVIMAADYISGLVVAGVFKNSKKSCNGALESQAGIKGLFRKVMMLFSIYMCGQIDILFNVGFAAMMMVNLFIINEALSIVENGELMGLNYPKAVKKAIGSLSKKGESKNDD